jgi:hypothetical protein
MTSNTHVFGIRINKADFFSVITNKIQEKGKKAFLIKGNLVPFFEKEILNYEKTSIESQLSINLQATKARLNSIDDESCKSLRSDACYFRGNKKCNE